MDLQQRARTDQFTVELVRSMPQLTIPQARSAAVQLADAVHLPRLRDFGSLLGMVQGLQLRPLSEWESFGYEPTDDAVPVRLEVPREAENPTEPLLEDHYLSFHTRRAHPSRVQLPSFHDAVNGWRQRLGSASPPSLSYSGFAAGTGRALPTRRVEMLGNLWKIGAVATWEHTWSGESSWCYVDHRPQAGESPSTELSEWDAWYRIRIHQDIGRDVIVEITRCLAEILLGYVDKLWGPEVSAGRQRGAESEAAAYIALERLWIPQRTRRTDWYHRYVSGEPMPEEFRWNHVFRAAAEVEDLLRGDTTAVVATQAA